MKLLMFSSLAKEYKLLQYNVPIDDVCNYKSYIITLFGIIVKYHFHILHIFIFFIFAKAHRRLVTKLLVHFIFIFVFQFYAILKQYEYFKYLHIHIEDNNLTIEKSPKISLFYSNKITITNMKH